MTTAYQRQIKAQKEEAKRLALKQKHDRELAEREERERRLAKLKSIANIQRKSRIRATELKIKEEQTKRRLKKVKGQSSISRILLGKSKKKKKHDGGIWGGDW
jgi:hypothetical protein